MNATVTSSHTCSVCHRMLTSGESFLLQRRSGRSTAVHRHLCYPPATARAARTLPVFYHHAA